MRAKLADRSLPIGDRERLALETAATLDRAAQSSATVDQQRARWSESAALLDRFHADNGAHPRSGELALQAAVYLWARAQYWLRQWETNPSDGDARRHAVEELDEVVHRLRKVVSERAAVLASDAPREVGQTESLLGAQIRSVLGVPLWKGEEILGVLQMDNRESTGVFTSSDLDVCAVLGHVASLAVANGRLVQRLRAAEEKLEKENRFLKSREESRRVGKGEQEIIGRSLTRG